jgi:phosphomannomutase
MLAFGTSGLRGLVTEMTDEAVIRYTRAFITLLRKQGVASSGTSFAIGCDLRPSSPTIARAVATAVAAEGLTPLYWGILPTPALAYVAGQQNIASIMVTGSHIPFDRNGLKFYLPSGEISKAEESAITVALEPASTISLLPLADDTGDAVRQAYLNRYTAFFPADLLHGQHIGVYQHSAVTRDLLVMLCEQLGATVTPLGRTDHFVPVDTEAVSAEDEAQAAAWCAKYGLDAILSSDGDGDRPLMFTEAGGFIRGDIVGLLTARHLKADVVITPLTSSSAIEKSGSFPTVIRTKVGSPYVIEAMDTAQRPDICVVGFEANGGVLLGSSVGTDTRQLLALPTRDAFLPLLCVLAEAKSRSGSLKELLLDLPTYYTESRRIQNIDRPQCQQLLEQLQNDPAFLHKQFTDQGALKNLNSLDGLRLTFEGGQTIHLRLSGNAPELRIYIEAPSPEAAKALAAWALERITTLLHGE